MKLHPAILALALALAPPTPAMEPTALRQTMDQAAQRGREAARLVVRDEVRAFWSKDGARFAYRVDLAPNRHRFFKIDLPSGTKSPAFDHDALAAALSSARGIQILPDSLPIDQLEPPDGGSPVLFEAFGTRWRFDPATRNLEALGAVDSSAHLLAPEELPRSSYRRGGNTSLTLENGTTGPLEVWWMSVHGDQTSYGTIAPGESDRFSTYSGHSWLVTDSNKKPLAGVVAQETPIRAKITGRVQPGPRKSATDDSLSPDGRWRAIIRHHNLAVEPAAGGEAFPLTTDGSPEHGYSEPFHWSPDSNKLIAFRTKQVSYRKVHIVKTSPEDQLQPELLTLDYPKPGDPLPQTKPRLFDIQGRRQIPVDDSLFANPWEIDECAWTPDSTTFSFVYNQRGHQVLRLIALQADSGSTRTIIEETSPTFIDYAHKFFLRRLPGDQGILWASERSGYNHLYRFNPQSGDLLNPVTQGNWNVREVVEVNTEKRQLLLKVVGLPGSNPYYHHFIRVNFDGSGLTRLTTSDGCHRISFSPCRRWIIATWSRVDHPPVHELRDANDGRLIAEIERADDSALTATGWSRPERFTAKGRDGKTDIHGIIVRPTRFDPAKSYPVVESIYAGPHDHFVPNRFAAWGGLNKMAELGFVVVQIDGMGTNWRSKAFHDVCWKNIKDAGFPDRIAWIRAAAATRPWMDVSRVGIFGGSAGGQNALAALLHHGDFYQAAVADCGCHDNRMDKVWWNEAWMGWPVDASYADNSNVTHAAKLRGKLLLIVGELDDNVDPASTYQVVGALQKAGKDFEFMPIINTGHGAAESPYGAYRRAEFLVRTLQAR